MGSTPKSATRTATPRRRASGRRDDGVAANERRIIGEGVVHGDAATASAQRERLKRALANHKPRR